MARKTLDSADKVAAHFGSWSRLAVAVGANRKQVDNWRRSKRFPSSYFVAIDTELARCGLRASPSLFGMVKPQKLRAQRLSA